VVFARRTSVHKEQPMSEQPTDRPPVMESGVEAAGGMASLTPLAQRYLDQTRPWVRFISILTFVSAAVMLLLGAGMLAFSLFGGLAAGSNGAFAALGGPIGAGITSLLYIVFAFVYVAPGVYLFRYASAIRDLNANSNAAALEDALKHQKSFWRYVGILTAATVVVVVVLIILAVVVGVLAALMAARS
jgi:hypothetical protein